MPGSILAYDVLDSRENLLMKAGLKLTVQSLAILERKNISHIHIVDDVIQTPEQLEIIKKTIEESLAFRFRKSSSSPEMRKLQSILLAYQLEK
ncbi:MAG: hypothetical protein KAS48_05170 [Gammaproteobacteria bacterium]|nr:hypothetical protein [Gammaproteobacteria bacterium]